MNNLEHLNNHFGLLGYSESYNLGDEVQSIAAKQYLPHVDFLINRNTGSQLELSKSKTNQIIKKIKTIYNGWFDGQYCQFPPPSIIDPLFISFHINETDHSKDPSYKVLNNNKLPFKSLSSHINYLKSYEPIGCRDFHTMNLLKKQGISAYFSGCLTLTLLNRFDHRNDNILVVDSHILCNDLYKKIIPEHIRKRAIHLSQSVNKIIPHDEKMKLAQELLDKYAKAKLVITSRLHTALPCLAFGTPVIFLHDNLSDVRFSGLSQFLKVYTNGDTLDIDIDNYQNTYTSEFYDLVKKLKDSVRKWINNDSNKNCLSGYSIFTACMNRNMHLEKALPTWLATNPDEIVIVDWGSRPSIKPIIDHYNHSKKIKLISVPNVDTWNLTKSFNLAARVTSYSNLLKVDCDSVLDSNFFSYHNLSKDCVFFAGNWKKSRNENERHTNGIVYMKRDDFFKIGGYNELINTYGYDDCDLYKRLEFWSKRLMINLDSIKHIEHSNKNRIENQSLKHPDRIDIEIERNRLISELNIWNGSFSSFNIKKISDVEYFAEYLYGIELNELIRESLLEKACKNRENSSQKSCHHLKKLYINTKNGLSNRLRALISAYNIAKETNRQLIVIWIPDFHCEAKFTDLFRKNYLFKDVIFIENENNMNYINVIKYQCAEYEDLDNVPIIYNYDKLKDKYIDDTTPNDIYVISACTLNNKHTNWTKDSFVLRHFDLNDDVANEIYKFESKYKIQEAIGVHIRMGQHSEQHPYENISNYNEYAKQSVIKWRACSHWSFFIKKMDEIILENPEQVFFLCCDNAESYEKIIESGKYKIIHTHKKVFDRSLEQVKTAIIDLVLLSKTKYILGSNWSSFTEISHRLGGKPLKLAGIDF